MKTATKTRLAQLLPKRWVTAIRLLRNADHVRDVLDFVSVNSPLRYKQDGLATIHNCDFMSDKRFSDAYRRGRATGSWGNAEVHWRAFVACWAAERAVTIDGDFVECGVNRGGLARTVIEFVRFHGLAKKFWLLDTYAGLVDKYVSEEEKGLGIKAGGYEECYDAVVAEFRDLDNVRIIRGMVPETLQLLEAEKVAYLSIDMNCVAPEIAAAEFMWNKLSSGAVVVLDDYGWPGHILQKRAFDQFAADRGVRVLALPTGQGLIIKQ